MPIASFRNWTYAVALAIPLLGGFTVPSWAHAELVSAVPAADAVVTALPDSVVLTFSEAIEPAFSSVKITGPAGIEVTGTSLAVDPANAASIVITLPSELPVGHITIDWVAVAADGHKTSGSYAFDIVN